MTPGKDGSEQIDGTGGTVWFIGSPGRARSYGWSCGDCGTQAYPFGLRQQAVESLVEHSDQCNA